jgi:hypothetical protein
METRIFIVRAVQNDNRDNDVATSIQVALPTHWTLEEQLKYAEKKVIDELRRYFIHEAVTSTVR